jgi:hypothetical protein
MTRYKVLGSGQWSDPVFARCTARAKNRVPSLVPLYITTEMEWLPIFLRVRYFGSFCTSSGSHSNRVMITPDRAMVCGRIHPQ